MKIISGGQTGVDQMGLKIAFYLGIETGGCAPKGWRTEKGPAKELLQFYNLIQHNSSSYQPRTEMNVMNSDVTLLFGDMESPGSITTLRYCVEHGKPYMKNPTANKIHKVIMEHNFNVINIAGNRGSKISGEQLLRIAGVLKQGLSNVRREREGISTGIEVQ